MNKQYILLLFLIIVITLINYETFHIHVMLFLIINRGILAPNCFWWKISDLILKDASGVNLYYNLKEKYGKIIPVNMFGNKIHMITEINFIKQLLDKSPHIFGVGKLKYNMFKSFMKNNVGVSEGCPWMRRRILTIDTLDSTFIPRYAHKYHKFISQLFMENPVPTNFDTFSFFSKKITMKVVFGTNIINEDIFKIFSAANSLKIFFFNKFQIPTNTMGPYVKYLTENISNPNDYSLISIALEHTHNYDELIHHIPHWIFPIAGLIPTTFARMLILLCNHKNIFCKLINKINQININNPADVYNCLFLRKCILETFRLNNPVVTTFRTLLQDYSFDEHHHYDKGTQFLFLNNPVLRDPIFFENPNNYVPERWTLNMEKSYYSVMFNQGPQKCPGKEMAIFLLQSFTVNYLKFSKILTNGISNIKCNKVDPNNIPQMINPCNIVFFKKK